MFLPSCFDDIHALCIGADFGGVQRLSNIANQLLLVYLCSSTTLCSCVMRRTLQYFTGSYALLLERTDVPCIQRCNTTTA